MERAQVSGFGFRRLVGATLAVWIGCAVLAPARAAPVACPPTDKQALAEFLKGWGAQSSPLSIDIYSPYRITPAGGEMIVGIDRLYDDRTQDQAPVRGVRNLDVRAVFQLGRSGAPKTSDLFLSSGALAERMAGDDPFAKSVSLPDGSARVRFDVPDGLAGGTPLNWNEGRLFVIGCDDKALAFIGQMETSYSGWATSLATTVAVAAFAYLFAAIAVSRHENRTRVATRKISWVRCLDPVVLCSGPDAQGSMSRLQILFFSVLVFCLVWFILLRVGLLSAMSTTVLLLLGISAFGAAASKAADNHNERLSSDNWAWLVKKRWLPANGLASVNVAKWGDILTGSDGFDIYHFQMLIFSLVVGLGLLKVGFAGLATFTVPESLLALLGLTQVVYVTGKIVDQPTMKELDAALTDLRQIEDAFLAKTSGAESLKQAIDASDDAKKAYAAYAARRDGVLPVLRAVFSNYSPRDEFFSDGVKNPAETLEPGYPYPSDLPGR